VCVMEPVQATTGQRPDLDNKQRNALKRSQSRAEQRGEEFVDDRIECLICKRRGVSHKALNLTAHISRIHGLTASEYEAATGQPEGRGQIVSPSARKRLQEAGRKGAAHTQDLLRKQRDAAIAARQGAGTPNQSI
jgi:general stress protein YciG